MGGFSTLLAPEGLKRTREEADPLDSHRLHTQLRRQPKQATLVTALPPDVRRRLCLAVARFSDLGYAPGPVSDPIVKVVAQTEKEAKPGTRGRARSERTELRRGTAVAKPFGILLKKKQEVDRVFHRFLLR